MSWLALIGILAPGLVGWAAELGMPAPPLTIAEWIKGEPVDLQSGKGKRIYVVEFWATWCPPCRVSIPHLTELRNKFKDRHVAVIGISDESAGKVKRFVARMDDRMDYTVAVDQDRQTARAYMEAFGVRGIPHAFVIDTNGVIAWHGHPMAGLEETVEAILAGRFDIETAKKNANAERLFQQYFAMVATGHSGEEVDRIGEQILADGGGDPALLNEFAWIILTDPRVKNRDRDLALRAARIAYNTSKGEDASIIDTYARALFDTGKVAEAIRYQKLAVEKCDDARLRSEFKARLERYLKEGATEEI